MDLHKIIDEEISSINKSVKPINVKLVQTAEGIYKGSLPFKIDGDYVLNSKTVVNQPVIVDYQNNQVVIELDSKEMNINAFLSKDESSLLRAIKQNIKGNTLTEIPSFIIGPPGTGKTKVITKVLEETIKAKKRVLIASTTNMAVENVFERIDTKAMNLEDGDVVLTIKTDIELLQEFKLESIKKRRLQPIKDEIEILKMAKDDMVKRKKEIQPTLDSHESLKDATATKLVNYNRELVKKKHEYVEIDNVANSIIKRINMLTSNTFLKSVANVFMSKKLEELKDEQIIQEKKMFGLKKEIAFIEKKIEIVSNEDIEAAKKLKLSKKEIEEINISLNKISQRNKELLQKAEELKSNDFFKDAKIVGATLVGAALNKKIQEGDFDMLIVDEASMATIPYLIIVAQSLKENKKKETSKIEYKDDKNLYEAQNKAVEMAINSKIIFVGDPKQLPPIAKTHAMSQDIFNMYDADKIFDGEEVDNTVFLDINFRNHPHITALASKLFYNGLLKSGKEDNGKDSIYVRRSTSKMVSSKGSYINDINASIAIEQTRKALQRGRRSIGVISPYKQQSLLVEDGFCALREEFPDADIQAGTVHTFQGKEKEIIIYDLTFSPYKSSKNKIPATYDGDINSKTAKLLNVAMTRAEDFFIVIGDIDGIANLEIENLVLKQWAEEIYKIK